MSSRDPLDDLLDRWQPPAGETPDLRIAVRHAVSRAAAADRVTWWTQFEAAFARPSFAMAFVAACILLGLFLAEMRVSRLHAAYGAQIARSYVQLIDPLLQPETVAASGATYSLPPATPAKKRGSL